VPVPRLAALIRDELTGLRRLGGCARRNLPGVTVGDGAVVGAAPW
jgi:hypothetical protein